MKPTGRRSCNLLLRNVISKGHFGSKGRDVTLIRVTDPDPVFLPGSGSRSNFQISLDSDPDPVFKFLLIRIRFSNFSGSGFCARIPEKKQSAERALKAIY